MKVTIKFKAKQAALEISSNQEAEKLLRFAKQESYDGGPNSLKKLAYKVKAQTRRAYITKIKVSTNDITTRHDEGICTCFTEMYLILVSNCFKIK